MSCQLLAAQQMHVSAEGDDARGAGTAGAPFRTITRALRALGASQTGAATIRVALGQYDAKAGEAFPLRLPPGIRIAGHGSDLTVLEGTAGSTLIALNAGKGRVQLEGLTLRAAERGIALATAAGDDLALDLADVRFKQLATGIDLREAQGPRALRADGARFAACRYGIAVRGSAPLELELLECMFDGGELGLALESPADAGQSVDHTLLLRACQLRRQTIAAVRRSGGVGPNRAAAPYRFEDCVFEGAKAGIELERPAGDTPLAIVRCAFLGNASFGVKITGEAGDAALTSRIEQCLFRWNGVGMHIVNTQVSYELLRNRVVDNQGNGIFWAGFVAKTSPVRIANSLLANNGAAGLMVVADGEALVAEVVHNTIVANDGFGIEARTRHGGRNGLSIVACMIAGNSADLYGVDPTAVHGCLVADQLFAPPDLNRDPGLVDPLRRDSPLNAASQSAARGTKPTAEQASAK